MSKRLSFKDSDFVNAPFNVGDIIESKFWCGRGWEGEYKTMTGPYRIISRGYYTPHPSFLDGINMVKNPYIPPANFCFVVVPSTIGVGKERQTDYCYLNNFLPSLHPDIMRDVYYSSDYLIRRGSAKYVQKDFFT